MVEIPLDLDDGEIIVQMVAGKSHNLLLTSKGGIIFFGATIHNQMGKQQELGFEQSGPTEIKLPLLENETITRIKAGMD